MNSDDLEIGKRYLITADHRHGSLSNARRYSGKTGIIKTISRYANPRLRDTCNMIVENQNILVCIFADALSPVVEEFVLPKKWKVIVKTDAECDVVAKWCNENKLSNDNVAYGRVCKYRYIHSEEIIPRYRNVNFARISYSDVNQPDFTEITFEQFEKYVIGNKVSKAAPIFEILSKKGNGHITSVANSEGNIFELGDIVKTHMQKGIIINKFRYNYNRSGIYALTCGDSEFDINNIDHDIETLKKQEILHENIKSELKEDFVAEARLRFPNNCLIRTPYGTRVKIEDHSLITSSIDGKTVTYLHGSYILRTAEGKWAEIDSSYYLEQARLKYPFGTLFLNRKRERVTITVGTVFREMFGDIVVRLNNATGTCCFHTLYHKATDSWADIIE